MLQLPMTAFIMQGTNGRIELIIEEVWGYPHELSYGGGYGARGSLSVQADDFSVSAMHYFTTGELYAFYGQLKSCYDTLTGTAVLDNLEHELTLQCECTKLGHVIMTGSFQPILSIRNILQFEIHSDQTQLKEAMAQLEEIYAIFGDKQGKR